MLSKTCKSFIKSVMALVVVSACTQMPQDVGADFKIQSLSEIKQNAIPSSPKPHKGNAVPSSPKPHVNGVAPLDSVNQNNLGLFPVTDYTNVDSLFKKPPKKVEPKPTNRKQDSPLSTIILGDLSFPSDIQGKLNGGQLNLDFPQRIITNRDENVISYAKELFIQVPSMPKGLIGLWDVESIHIQPYSKNWQYRLQEGGLLRLNYSQVPDGEYELSVVYASDFGKKVKSSAKFKLDSKKSEAFPFGIQNSKPGDKAPQLTETNPSWSETSYGYTVGTNLQGTSVKTEKNAKSYRVVTTSKGQFYDDGSLQQGHYYLDTRSTIDLNMYFLPKDNQSKADAVQWFVASKCKKGSSNILGLGKGRQKSFSFEKNCQYVITTQASYQDILMVRHQYINVEEYHPPENKSYLVVKGFFNQKPQSKNKVEVNLTAQSFRSRFKDKHLTYHWYLIKKDEKLQLLSDSENLVTDVLDNSAYDILIYVSDGEEVILICTHLSFRDASSYDNIPYEAEYVRECIYSTEAADLKRKILSSYPNTLR